MNTELRFVCRRMPGAGNECVFIECEDANGDSVNAGEWRPRADGLAELVVKLPALAEQHQSEPVAWRGINELGEVVTDWIDGVPPSSMVDLRGNPASFASIEQAYTHTDPGEVERLRLLVQAGQEVESHLSKQIDIAEITIQGLRAQLETSHLREAKLQEMVCEKDAQLAEWDVLLRAASKLCASIWKRGLQMGGEQYPNAHNCIDIADRIDAAISASAEPSTPAQVKQSSGWDEVDSYGPS